MAAPNLKQPVTITGKTAVYSCTASLASALSNGAASGKVLKVNVVRASNLTTNIANVDVTVYRSSAHSYISKTANVAPGGLLVVVDKNEFIYLEEGDAIYAKANATSTIDLTITYEDIS
jgi:hypothetical protein